jgi:phosphate acetyltransferase
MTFLEGLRARPALRGRRIVLPEGHDERIREAALRLQDEGSVETVLLLPDPSLSPPPGFRGMVRCPADDPELDHFAELYREAGKRTRLSIEAARDMVRDPLYFGGLMLRAGDADGALAGADHVTSAVVSAALRCVGTRAGHRYVTGAFYMVVPSFRGSEGPEVLTFADSGVIPEPAPEQLVEIALQAAEMRPVIVGDVPHVAFLSFSTYGSAKGPAVDKMRAAFEMLKQLRPALAADGELQADAALIRHVAQRKAPESPVAGHANVLIFPDLNAGNIAYKLVERLAGATAIGPILHGLARPYNDLSRGADTESIVASAYVTALMAGGP